jgi:hypothetical protein
MEKQEIPGLTPLWVIDFKPKATSKARAETKNLLTDRMTNIANLLHTQCQATSDALDNCRSNTLRIQTELGHLNDIIEKFRSFIDKFPKPPPTKEFDSQ